MQKEWASYLLFTNRAIRSVQARRVGYVILVQGNTNPDLFIRHELARAVHESEGFVFPSTYQVTRLVNSSLMASPIFKDFNETNFPQMLEYMIISNVSMFTSLLSD